MRYVSEKLRREPLISFDHRRMIRFHLTAIGSTDCVNAVGVEVNTASAPLPLRDQIRAAAPPVGVMPLKTAHVPASAVTSVTPRQPTALHEALAASPDGHPFAQRVGEVTGKASHLPHELASFAAPYRLSG